VRLSNLFKEKRELTTEMAKKCIICGEEAKYRIKDSNDFYCEECAEENFDDVSVLQKVEEQAVKLKAMIDEKISEEEE